MFEVLGILVASLLAAVGGYVWLHVSLPPRAVRDSA